MVRKGEEVTLTLEKFADKGKSLARLDGYVVFVKGGVPGDQVRAKVTKRKKSYAEAHLLDVLEPSGMRTDARCRYFSTCGGCAWQHVGYEHQLAAKRQSVEEALRYAGGFDGVDVAPTLASEETFFYRNKMEFSFSTHRWLTPEEIATGKGFDTDFALGFHVPGNYYKVLDLQDCHLQSQASVEVVNAVRAFAKARDWKPWNIRKHHGYLRHLVLRSGTHTGDFMVNLVTSSYEAERMEALAAYLQEELPFVTTFVNTINSSKSQKAYGDETHVLFGPGVIYDRIGPHRFEIGPSAFFQTNTKGAETLYKVAREMANLQADDLLYDLYCGAGTISLFMADKVARVVGVDLIDEAIENAKTSAEANQVGNCTFVSGNLDKMFTPAFVETHGHPDVLIVDPPRAGLHPKVVEQIARLRPERFIYVSCNPQTQARDLKALGEHYRIEGAQPVDLFPHTDHVENIVGLRRR